MPEVDPTTAPRRYHEHGSASHKGEVRVAGLLRDWIVGITCSPDPLPRRGSGGRGDGGAAQSGA